MNILKFYYGLIIKKIKVRLHNLFEKKIESLTRNPSEYIEVFLWDEIKKKLVNSNLGVYYKSKVMNNKLPMTLAQARVLLSLCYDVNKTYNTANMELIVKIKDYVLALKGENGIYKFNQKSWNLQDEGIATIWILLALLETYKITKDETLLNEIISTINTVNKILFSKENSLAHTLGDDYWCLNAASTYAWFVNELIKYHKADELVENYFISINLCNSKIEGKEYFPYSEKRQGTYLLLYNPIVIFTISEAIKNNFIDEKLRIETESNLQKAREFLIKQMDKDNFFVEPEMKIFSRYIISNITALVALKNHIPKDLENSILSNISSYFINNKMYLCKDEDGKYYNGNLYEVNDVLMTEVLYWLTTYSNKN